VKSRTRKEGRKMIRQYEGHGEENVSKWYVLYGPILGLLYVVALPFIAIATVAALAGEKVWKGMVNLFGKSMSHKWNPTEAYLTGKKRGKKEGKENASKKE
jgi:hypothetical protein